MKATQFATKPGDFVKRILKKNNVSKNDILEQTCLSEDDINKIIASRIPLTANIAQELSKVTDKNASTFTNFQNRYDKEIRFLKFTI